MLSPDTRADDTNSTVELLDQLFASMEMGDSIPRLITGAVRGNMVLAAVVRESVDRHEEKIITSPGSSGDVLTAGSACSETSGSD